MAAERRNVAPGSAQINAATPMERGGRGRRLPLSRNFIGARIDRGGLLLPSYPAAIADGYCEGTMGAASRPSPGPAAPPFYLIGRWGRRGEGTFRMVMRFGHGGPGCCYFYPFYGYAQVLRCRIELWRGILLMFLVTSQREAHEKVGRAGARRLARSFFS